MTPLSARCMYNYTVNLKGQQSGLQHGQIWAQIQFWNLPISSCPIQYYNGCACWPLCDLGTYLAGTCRERHYQFCTNSANTSMVSLGTVMGTTSHSPHFAMDSSCILYHRRRKLLQSGPAEVSGFTKYDNYSCLPHLLSTQPFFRLKKCPMQLQLVSWYRLLCLCIFYKYATALCLPFTSIF